MRLRPYKSCDSEVIAKWVQDETVFTKWGGFLLGQFPIDAQCINDTYTLKNGLCDEPDNFYPWVAIDDDNRVVGQFIMRYIHGDMRIIRFGWVVVDDTTRGSGYGKQMLSAGIKYAFEILGAEKITLGVYVGNDLAYNCYKAVGFKDTEILEREPWNQIEMAITRDEYYKNK